MVLGLYHLTATRRGRGWARAGRSPRRPRRSWRTTARRWACRRRSRSGSPGTRRRQRQGPSRGRRRRAGSPGEPVLVETTLGRCLFNEALPEDYRVRQLRGDARRSSARSSTTWPSGTRRSQVAATPGRPQGGRLPLGDPVGHHHRHRRRGHPAAQARRSWTGTRGRREDREAVPARRDHRRGAPAGAHRDLDQGDQRGRQGDGGQLPARPTRSGSWSTPAPAGT